MKKQWLILGIISAALLVVGYNATNLVMTATDSDSQGRLAEITLRQNMRKLWTDHVIWTRSYIVATVSGSSDAQPASARLLKNQEDIGNAIAGYYGKTAGDELTNLLKQHILISVDLINAAKVADQAKFNDVNDQWKQNGQEIADFLSTANPHWPKQMMRDMMNAHLVSTIDEVTARLNKKYDEDVRAFDVVYDHVLMMADALSDGIIKKFPNKF